MIERVKSQYRLSNACQRKSGEQKVLPKFIEEFDSGDGKVRSLNPEA